LISIRFYLHTCANYTVPCCYECRCSSHLTLSDFIYLYWLFLFLVCFSLQYIIKFHSQVVILWVPFAHTHMHTHIHTHTYTHTHTHTHTHTSAHIQKKSIYHVPWCDISCKDFLVRKGLKPSCYSLISVAMSTKHWGKPRCFSAFMLSAQ
jgi:hypothetical protein